jgi:uncharacterized protein YqeY
MSMVQQLRDGVIAAMKSKDEDKKNIYRTVLGEVEMIQSTLNQAGKPVTDEQVQKICRSILVANLETIAVETSEDRKAKLVRENVILNVMIPQLLSQDDIREKLQSITADLKAAKSEGMAMSLAIKFFKTSKDAVDGNDVKAVVIAVRAAGE